MTLARPSQLRRCHALYVQDRQHILYSKADLSTELEGVMDVETFLLRIGPHLRKMFKSVNWGRDLIYALDAFEAEEQRDCAPIITVRSRAGGKGGHRSGRNRIAPESVV